MIVYRTSSLIKSLPWSRWHHFDYQLWMVHCLTEWNFHLAIKLYSLIDCCYLSTSVISWNKCHRSMREPNQSVIYLYFPHSSKNYLKSYKSWWRMKHSRNVEINHYVIDFGVSLELYSIIYLQCDWRNKQSDWLWEKLSKFLFPVSLFSFHF